MSQISNIFIRSIKKSFDIQWFFSTESHPKLFNVAMSSSWETCWLMKSWTNKAAATVSITSAFLESQASKIYTKSSSNYYDVWKFLSENSSEIVGQLQLNIKLSAKGPVIFFCPPPNSSFPYIFHGRTLTVIQDSTLNLLLQREFSWTKSLK